jgi:hypothetical protein
MLADTRQLQEKWNKLIAHKDLPEIKDAYRKSVTAVLLENTEKAIQEQRQVTSGFLTESGAPNNVTTGVSNWDPILISLVRRSMPNLVAYDIAGVQPMTGPTGLIFAMKSKYTTQGGTEALFNEANTAFAGAGTHGGDSSSLVGTGGAADASPGDGVADNFDFGTGLATIDGERLGSGESGDGSFSEMAFSIEKATVTAKTRALKAEYTIELAQDLKAIHGLDAEAELANILSTEILAEINREVIRTVNSRAKLGAQQANIADKGVFSFSTDADGRWSVEKFKGLLVQIDRESNVIAKETRRGRGNFILCSSDVATALAAAGALDYAPALATTLQVDDTGNTFAGVLNGRTKVYIDPYATVDYVTVGYRGSNPYDAGLFYCPYVPLTMVRAVGENTFQPKIGFKTRYGMVANPFVGASPAGDIGAARANPYFRIFKVDDLLVSTGS